MALYSTRESQSSQFLQGWNWEVRAGKWFAQDPTTSRVAGHRPPSDCCVLKHGVPYSNPSFLTCHQAKLSNTLCFPSYSQLFITVGTDLLVPGSVCAATLTQKIWKPLMCDFITSQYMLIKRDENSRSSGEKKTFRVPGEKRWVTECVSFHLRARNRVNDQHICILHKISTFWVTPSPSQRYLLSRSRC